MLFAAFAPIIFRADWFASWGWADMREHVKPISLLALSAIAAASVLAGVLVASHLERAWRAGRGFRHVAVIATLFVGGSMVVDYLAVELGWSIFSETQFQMPHPALLALGGVFVLFARPALGFIISGMSGIDDAERKAQDALEHERGLEERKAATEEFNARIEAGKSQGDNIIGFLKKAGLPATVLATLFSLPGALPEQAHAAPTEPANPTMPAQQNVRDPITERLLSEEQEPAAQPMARGPRVSHQEKYEQLAQMLDESPNLSNRRASRAIGVDRRTVKQWRADLRLRNALAYPQNAPLIDAA